MATLLPRPARPAQLHKTFKVTYLTRAGNRGHYRLIAKTAGEARWAMEELLPQAKVVRVLVDNDEW